MIRRLNSVALSRFGDYRPVEDAYDGGALSGRAVSGFYHLLSAYEEKNLEDLAQYPDVPIWGLCRGFRLPRGLHSLCLSGKPQGSRPI